jgi:hypothetical protein
MGTVGVLLAAVAVVGFVLYWSGRHGTRGRDSGTSLRRGPSAHTTLTGRPKIAYGTREEAAAQALSMIKRDGTPMSVYRCGTCAKWHVGHAR